MAKPPQMDLNLEEPLPQMKIWILQSTLGINEHPSFSEHGGYLETLIVLIPEKGVLRWSHFSLVPQTRSVRGHGTKMDDLTTTLSTRPVCCF